MVCHRESTGGDLADTTRRLQADRVEPRRDKTIFQLRCLTQVIADVRGKALGAAEEFLDARFSSAGKRFMASCSIRGKVIKITGDLIEAEVLGDTLLIPGLAEGSKAPTSNLPASYL